MAASMQPVQQFVLNLRGMSSDPLKLTGGIMDEEDVLETSLKKNDQLTIATMNLFRLELAYYFGDLALASRLAIASCKYAKGADPHFLFSRRSFMDGLVSLAVARITKRPAKRIHLLISAGKMIKQIGKWVEGGSGSMLHMLKLLEAERGATNAKLKWDQVKKTYDDAISIAGRNGFVQDRALANELAGIFVMDREGGMGREDKCYWASYYLTQAYELYLAWGAKAKADQLFKIHGESVICSEAHNENAGAGVRGRSRFTDHTKPHKQLNYATGLDQETSAKRLNERSQDSPQ